MSMTMRYLVLLLLAGLGIAACTSEAQRKQESEAKAEIYGTQCEHSLGLIRGQSITNDQRVDLQWCMMTLFAKDKLRQGSKDMGIRFVGLYIPNCEAILGKDWGEVGSEKRRKLVSCIQMQAERDLEWEDKVDRALLIQGMRSWMNKQAPINCYTYGNWTQCR